MKENVIVAAVQTDILLLDMPGNLRRMEEAVKRAKTEGNADLVVFPELASIGYIRERNKDFGLNYIKEADKIPGEFTNAVGAMAKEYGVYIVTGMTEAHPQIPGTLYNSAVLLDPKGELAGRHRKVHMPGYEKHYFIAANNAEVFHTDLGNLGICICYDCQFAELTRTLALKGTEILLMLWNMPDFSNKPDILHHLTATRAFENRFYAVSCNRIGENSGIRFFGHSAVADPLGNLIATAGEEDVILYAKLERDMVLRERAQMPVFRDRRPDMYEELTKPL